MRIKRCLSMALALLLMATGAVAQTLTLYYVGEGSPAFRAAHPRLQIRHSQQDYNNAYQLAAVMLTGEFDSDLFSLNSRFHDPGMLIRKGYCLDLSGDAWIRHEVERLHPSVAAQLTRDGGVYAVPDSIQLELFTVDRLGWQLAGYGEKEVPHSYPELLGFLEQWCRRVEAQPEPGIAVKSDWAEELYGPHSYVAWLTELLVESVMMQRQYAGQPLRFDDPALLPLLKRAERVGRDIHHSEPAVRSGPQLLHSGSYPEGWPRDAGKWMISTRLSGEQPMLIEASLGLVAVYARTKEAELAVALARDQFEHRLRPKQRALLYRNAEPVRNPSYEQDMQLLQQKLAACEQRLAVPGIPVAERNEQEGELKRLQERVAALAGREYILDARQLQEYAQYAPRLYFPTLGAFVPSTDTGQNYRKLVDRFAAGGMTAQAFLQELDRMAHMVQLEQGDR